MSRTQPSRAACSSSPKYGEYAVATCAACGSRIRSRRAGRPAARASRSRRELDERTGEDVRGEDIDADRGKASGMRRTAGRRLRSARRWRASPSALGRRCRRQMLAPRRARVRPARGCRAAAVVEQRAARETCCSSQSRHSAVVACSPVPNARPMLMRTVMRSSGARSSSAGASHSRAPMGRACTVCCRPGCHAASVSTSPSPRLRQRSRQVGRATAPGSRRRAKSALQRLLAATAAPRSAPARIQDRRRRRAALSFAPASVSSASACGTSAAVVSRVKRCRLTTPAAVTSGRVGARGSECRCRRP